MFYLAVYVYVLFFLDIIDGVWGQINKIYSSGFCDQLPWLLLCGEQCVWMGEWRSRVMVAVDCVRFAGVFGLWCNICAGWRQGGRSLQCLKYSACESVDLLAIPGQVSSYSFTKISDFCCWDLMCSLSIWDLYAQECHQAYVVVGMVYLVWWIWL